jgi:hypothetical protein
MRFFMTQQLVVNISSAMPDFSRILKTVVL